MWERHDGCTIMSRLRMKFMKQLIKRHMNKTGVRRSITMLQFIMAMANYKYIIIVVLRRRSHSDWYVIGTWIMSVIFPTIVFYAEYLYDG